MYNPFDDEQVDQDESATVVYEGVKYGVDEAEALARWLNDEKSMALLNRYLNNVRQASVDMMDGGLITMDNAEELVRQSAMRRLIFNIQTMGTDVSRQLEAIDQSETDVEENV